MENKKISSRRHFPKSYTSCGFDIISHETFDRNNLMTQSFPRSKINERTTSTIKNNQEEQRNESKQKLYQKSRSTSNIPTSTTSTVILGTELTEYRDNYKPFLYGYKMLPVVVSPAEALVRNNAVGQVVLGLQPQTQQLSNGDCNGAANDVTDGPILVPVEKVLIKNHGPMYQAKDVQKMTKIRKTEYKAKFRPFSAYVYIPKDGLFRKPKDVDPCNVTNVNDWLYEVTERSAKAAEFSRRSKFGHPICGVDHLESIYQQESKGPWYQQLKDQSDILKNEITMINLNKFHRGNYSGKKVNRTESSSRIEGRNHSAPLTGRRNQSADRTASHVASPLSGSTSPTKPPATGGRLLNGKEPAAAPRRPLAKSVQNAKRSDLGSSPIGKIWMKASPPTVPEKSPVKDKPPTPPKHQQPLAQGNNNGPKPPPRRSVGSIKPPSTITSTHTQMNGSKAPSNGNKGGSKVIENDLMSSGVPTSKIDVPTLIPIPVANNKTDTSRGIDIKNDEKKNTIWNRIKEQDEGHGHGVGRGFESSLSHESSFSS